MHEGPLHSFKDTVSCGVHLGNVTGPYFFEDGVDSSITVTGERYIIIINEFLLPHFHELDLENMFQKNSATAHTARATMNLLGQDFPAT